MTWEGGDYIPRVWDHWLADPHGALVVGVDARDEPVALGRLAVPAPGEGFIEGVRVAPAVRRQGWGRTMFAHLRALANGQGLPTVRFLTEASNTPVHRLAASLGFTREGEFLPVRIEGGVAAPAPRAGPADTARLWALVADIASGVPIRWQSWAAATATREWFAAQVAQGRVLLAAGADGLVVMGPSAAHDDPEAVLLERPAPPGVVEIALLAGPTAASAELLDAARGWAARQGAARLFGLLPPAAGAIAQAAGWTAYTQQPMWLYIHYSRRTGAEE